MSVAYPGSAGTGLSPYGEQKHSAFGEQRFGAAAPTSIAAAAPALRDLERQYHVVLQDSLGHPALGFRDGTWFRLTVSGPQPLQLRGAIRHCPHAAGSIVQIACWWMRENPLQPRSLDLATELALTVGELVRVCPADGLGSSSQDLAPLPPAAMQQVVSAQPQVAALPPGPAPVQPQAQAAAPTGSWFDPTETSTGGFPAIPPAPMMPQSAPSAPAYAAAAYSASPSPGHAYPPAQQGYGSAPAPQAALPATTQAYAPQPAAQRPAPTSAAPARGYGEAQQQSDWDRPAAPRRPAAPAPQSQSRPQAQIAQNAMPPAQSRPQTGQPGQQQPRPPRPQQQRPEFRDERRDTFERRLGLEEDGPDDRGLDRSSDRNGVPPRRPSSSSQNSQPPRGSMGRRPATRPGRQSDW